MRIAFLISTVHDIGGTAGAVATQANALAARPRRRDPQRLPPHEATTSRSTRGSGARPGDDPPRARPKTQRSTHGGWSGRERGPRASTPSSTSRSRPRCRRWRPTCSSRSRRRCWLRRPARAGTRGAGAPGAPVLVASAQQPGELLLRLRAARRRGRDADRADGALAARRARPEATPRVVVVPNALAPGYRPRSLLTEPVIVAAGRLAGEKQWPQLVAAFSLIADQMPGLAAADLRRRPGALRDHAGGHAASGSGTASSCPAPPPTWPANGRAPASRR